MSPKRRPTSSTSMRYTRSSGQSARTPTSLELMQRGSSPSTNLWMRLRSNIRSREDKLVDAMVIYLLNLPEQKARQTLCVMPTNRTEKPTSWEEIKDGNFYIINWQHSIATSRLITQVGSEADDNVKNDFRVWSCFIVWSSDAEILRSISAYYNRINHFQMIQPSWATNILGARTVWVSMGCPKNPSQITAVETTAARRAQDVQS